MKLTIPRRPRTLAALLGGVLGLAVTGAGVAHSVAVTNVAYSTGRGYDARLGTLLAVGVAVLTPGLLLTVHSWRLVRGHRQAAPHVVASTAAVLLLCLLLAPLDPGFGKGAIGVGTALTAILALLARERAVDHQTSQR